MMSRTTPSELGPALKTAWLARSAFHQNPNTNAYRIFHGYAEGIPGLSIDRYGDSAIINKKADIPLADENLVAILESFFPFKNIVLKSHQKLDAPNGERVRFLKGHPSEKNPFIIENGDRYLCDLNSLHTNGLYLDARPAREWVKNHSKDLRVYNMFAHTGSLGMAAMLGGAKEVVHIDKSREHLDRIKDNYLLNHLTPDSRSIVTGDIYFHLPRAIKSGQTFDAIILDPPPIVPPPPKAPKHRPHGQDFATLIELVTKIMKPGAWLLTIYHNFRISHEDYDRQIINASNGTLAVTWQGRAHSDFVETDPDRWTRMSAFTLKA